MSGGTDHVSQTTTQNLTPEQRRLIQLAMPGAESFAAHPPQRPPGSQVAPFDPLQTQAQTQALGAVPGQQSVANAGAGGQTFLSSGAALNPNSNPALQGTINAAVRPIQENLVSSTLPAIRSEFVGAGQYGGSRQGIAEGLASRSASQAIADASSKVATEGYNSGLDAMGRSLAFLPSTLSSMTAPAQTTGAVGDVRQAMTQAGLSEGAANWTYDQMLPFLTSSDIISLVSGIPGGSVSTTGTQPGRSPLATALGGVSLATGLFGGGAGMGLLPAVMGMK